MASIVDSVRVVLGLETKGFGPAQSAIRSFTQGAQSQFASLKNQVAGFFTVAAGTALVRSVTQMAERWKDLSEQTGLSTDAIQKYDFAFKKVGLTAENAAQAFDVLTEKRREALEEGGGAELLFRKFGISEEELRSLNTGAALFERLARGRSTANQGDRELFGQMFGARGGRSGKLLAGAAALAEGGPNSTMPGSDIETIDKAAKELANAMTEFKIAAGPLTAALMGWTGAALKFWGQPGNASKFTGVNASLSIRDRLRGLMGGGGDPEAQDRITAMQKQLIAMRSPPMQGPMPEAIPGEYSRTIAAARAKLDDALHGVMFKAGNPSQQAAMLDRRMRELSGEANAEKDPVKAAGIRAEMIRLAGQRAGMSAGGSLDIGADALAQAGGIVGGAGMMDPSLTVEQSQLSVLERILANLEGQPETFRRAVAEAFRGQPIDQIGGGR